jgi:hypothetical protein
MRRTRARLHAKEALPALSQIAEAPRACSTLDGKPARMRLRHRRSRCRSRRRAGRKGRESSSHSPRPTMTPDFVRTGGALVRAVHASARRLRTGVGPDAAIEPRHGLPLWFRISGPAEDGREASRCPEIRMRTSTSSRDCASGSRGSSRQMSGAAVRESSVDRRDHGVGGEARASLATRSARRSRLPGLPFPTAQKPQWRVQTSPMSMNVAVRSRAQHSWMLGQRASSQTVTRERRRIIWRTSSYSPVVFSRTFSQSGRSRR